MTLSDSLDIERVQKNSLKVILQNDYVTYGQALEDVGLDSLYNRRESLCLSFAKKCTKSANVRIREMFPLNELHSSAQTRNTEKYTVQMTHKERFKTSALPYMQRLLNSHAK